MLSRLFAIVALLALNAFFVAVEFALGTQRLYDFLHANPAVELLTVDFVPWTLGFYARHGFRVLSRAELDARLRRELSLEEGDRGRPEQRSFDGRIVAARSLRP